MKILTRLILTLVVALSLVLPALPTRAADQTEMYFFYDQNCPYCQQALKKIETWKTQYPYLKIRQFEVTQNEANGWIFYSLSQIYSYRDMSVPAFFIDRYVVSGFNDSVATSLEKQIELCNTVGCVNPGALLANNTSTTELPPIAPIPNDPVFPKIMIFTGLVFSLLIVILAFKKFLTG